MLRKALQKAITAIVALAALATAAATGVIALAFALYALLRGPLGPAGAAASVAGLCAVVIALVGFLAARGAGLKGEAQVDDSENIGLLERLLDLVRDRPMASAGVALAAGLLLMRNPAVIGVILRTLLETWGGSGSSAPAKGRRR